MTYWIGTSGYNYPEWRGSFYPPKLPTSQMLPYYAERFSSVEINASFYRMPTEQAVQGWSQATPERFRLTLKAPKRITHISAAARLRRLGRALRTGCHDARAEARRAAVSAAAVFAKGLRVARRLSAAAAATDARGI